MATDKEFIEAIHRKIAKLSQENVILLERSLQQHLMTNARDSSNIQLGEYIKYSNEWMCIQLAVITKSLEILNNPKMMETIAEEVMAELGEI